MSKVEGNYASTAYSGAVQSDTRRGAENVKAQKAKTAEQSGRTQLSRAAQNLLKKLQKTYGNMDFMAADYENEDEAKDILSRGTKEFSVLFSREELEKMASDEKYEKEYMERVQGAVRMTEQINRQFGFGKGSDKGTLTQVGISFNKDGSMSYFAELEKTNDKQWERIEKNREKRADEKKKTTVKASSMNELITKMRQIDWSKVKEERKAQGDKLDFSI